MDNITFAIATPAQHAIILDILQETQAWLWAKGINQWTLPFTSEWIQESLARQAFCVAIINHEITAVVRLVDTDPAIWEDSSHEALYIHSLAVRRAWRGHEIGRRLLQWVETHAAHNQYRYLRLDCMADNAALCRYYEQLGFVACGLKELPSGDDLYKARLFEKPVAAS